ETFYDTRLPADVADVRTFDSWRKRAEAADPRVLYMTRADVLVSADLGDVERAFPASLDIDGVSYRLKYSFAPGAADDGVSIQVPLGLLRNLRAERVDWMVPGLLPNQCEALLRSLPKSLRRQLTPIPEKVDALVRGLLKPDVYAHGRIDLALGRLIEQTLEISVPADAWHAERMADHLHMNVQVRDEAASSSTKVVIWCAASAARCPDIQTT
ncbi:MAG: DUF3418 domain-containing protein, partial [Gammaproteobacteria bacterium]|nr:DUF3418 domain-containing protein [Gammaproteobacteria bacterium]